MAAVPPRLDNETDPAYAAFACYCLMADDRSTARVGRELGKTKKLMDRWSGRHRWVERAREYDAAVIAERAQAVQDSYIERLRREQDAVLKDAEILRLLAVQMIAGIKAGIVVTGDDGKQAVRPLQPQAIMGALKALQLAHDLSAHGLQIEQVRERLDGEHSS